MQWLSWFADDRATGDDRAIDLSIGLVVALLLQMRNASNERSESKDSPSASDAATARLLPLTSAAPAAAVKKEPMSLRRVVLPLEASIASLAAAARKIRLRGSLTRRGYDGSMRAPGASIEFSTKARQNGTHSRTTVKTGGRSARAAEHMRCMSASMCCGCVLVGFERHFVKHSPRGAELGWNVERETQQCQVLGAAQSEPQAATLVGAAASA